VAHRRIPGLPVSMRRGVPIENRHGSGEYDLADDGHSEPEYGDSSEGFIRDGRHFELAGHYGGAHIRFSRRAVGEATSMN
jgi:hypothetical protein